MCISVTVRPIFTDAMKFKHYGMEAGDWISTA